MRKKQWIAGLLAAVMLVCLVPQGLAAPQQASPYATRGQVVEMLLTAADDYNADLAKEQIVQGNGDGNLRENDSVTRAEAMVMLRRAFGKFATPMGDSLRTGYSAVQFTDVPQWAAEDIGALTAAGILAGTGENKLSPQDNVTVEQMELMIRRVWALQGSNLKDDFYATVNNEWLRNSTVPAGEIYTGAMAELGTTNNKAVAEIIEKAAQSNAAKGSKDQKIGDFYKGVLALQEGKVNDLSPIKPYLEAMDKVETVPQLIETLEKQRKELGMGNLLAFGLMVDLKDSSKYSLTFNTIGADLTKDYFEAGGPVMESYRTALEKLLLLSGETAENAKAQAAKLYQMQETLAKATMSVQDQGNVDKIYNIYTMAQLQELFPEVDLKNLLTSQGFKLEDKIGVMDPGLLKAAAPYYTQENLGMLKALAKLSLVQGMGSTLSSQVQEVNRELQAAIYGDVGSKPAKEVAAQVTQQVMGDYVGQVYVQQHFSAKAKADVTQMIKDFIGVYKQRLQKLDWMSQETKDMAIKKLDSMTVKVGYPDKWATTMDGVEITDSYYQNTIAMAKAQQKSIVELQGKSVDKSGWMMTVYTVNAYYSATSNEIVFPAGILQAPFYDEKASREENLGGIGFIIAHEITHSFDNNGAKFDAKGNATDWWKAEDYAHFQTLCQKAVEYYDGVEVAPGTTNRGEQTLSENIADLGAMACILDAAAQQQNPNYKALFENLAKCWTMSSNRNVLQMLQTADVHSFNKVRANRTLQSFEKFYETFGIAEGDGMYLPLEERIAIW